MKFEITGKIFYWRGPAPFYFVAIPEDHSLTIKDISPLVTYGWGAIPVQAEIGGTRWSTSLFPKDGLYLVPIKDMVRKAEDLAEGDEVIVQVEIKI